MPRFMRLLPSAFAVALLLPLFGCGHPVLDVHLGPLPMMLGRVEILATLAGMPTAAGPPSLRMSKAVFYKIANNQYSTMDPGMAPPGQDMATVVDMASITDQGAATDQGTAADMSSVSTLGWTDMAEFILDMPTGLSGQLTVQVGVWLNKDDMTTALIGDCMGLDLSGNQTYPLQLQAVSPPRTCPLTP